MAQPYLQLWTPPPRGWLSPPTFLCPPAPFCPRFSTPNNPTGNMAPSRPPGGPPARAASSKARSLPRPRGLDEGPRESLDASATLAPREPDSQVSVVSTSSSSNLAEASSRSAGSESAGHERPEEATSWVVILSKSPEETGPVQDAAFRRQRGARARSWEGSQSRHCLSSIAAGELRTVTSKTPLRVCASPPHLGDLTAGCPHLRPATSWGWQEWMLFGEGVFINSGSRGGIRSSLLNIK